MVSGQFVLNFTTACLVFIVRKVNVKNLSCPSSRPHDTRNVQKVREFFLGKYWFMLFGVAKICHQANGQVLCKSSAISCSLGVHTYAHTHAHTHNTHTHTHTHTRLALVLRSCHHGSDNSQWRQLFTPRHTSRYEWIRVRSNTNPDNTPMGNNLAPSRRVRARVSTVGKRLFGLALKLVCYYLPSLFSVKFPPPDDFY